MIRKEFLPVSRPEVSNEEIKAAKAVLRSGWWTTGPKVTEFEDGVVDYLKDSDQLYAVGLNSCTAGLHLSLVALGIGPGDEVIVPTWTFAATAQVVDWVGAKLVLCDVEEDSLNIDLKKASRLVTSRTKAIIPVHIAGYPCDVDGINKLAQKHGLKVIEDAAHAIGTRYFGKKIGNFSDLAVFSFYATKNLAMGEGGLVISRNKGLIETIRKKSYFGINKEAFKRYGKTGTWFYDIEEVGYKYNLDSLHAAIGLVQLKKLDKMLAKRRKLAAFYRKELHGLVGFTKDSEEHFHNYHLFMVKIGPSGPDRDKLIIELKKRNIGTGVHYIPLHMHSYYKNRFRRGDFPVANKVFNEILSIPMFSAMNLRDAGYVTGHLKELLRG